MGRFAALLVSGFVVAGCASTTTSGAKPEGAVTAPSVRSSSVRISFPKDKPEQSSFLLGHLKASGARSTSSSGKQKIYRVFDLDCRTTVEGKRTCSFADSFGCRVKSCRRPVKDPEGLSNLLFDLPVAQGDSGAETPFIECTESTTEVG
ncbi:MAG: hypothetical protein AAB250_04830, partial [Bdellovibrionota bacterium]